MAKKRTDNRGRVLRQGESQRKDGRYAYRWQDINGKRYTVYAKSLPELRKEEERIQRDRMDGLSMAGTKTTLNDFYDYFMQTKDIRANTRIGYETNWKNHVAPTIGQMKIADIKQIHVKRLYADLKKEGLKSGSIKNVHSVLLQVLQMAVDNDYLRKNPAKGCAVSSKKDATEKKALTREEQGNFLEYVRNSSRFKPYYPIIVFALMTGLRFGELSGLRWSNVDMKKNVVHIKEQLIYRNIDGQGYQFYTGEPKSAAGKRDIPLLPDARKALIQQKELDLIFGKGSKREEIAGHKDYIFTTYSGKPYTESSLNTALREIVKAYNEEHDETQLPKISPHILRHSFCSRMAESGMNPKSLQYIMGHENISVTMDIYTHIDFAQIQKNMEQLEYSVKIG